MIQPVASHSLDTDRWYRLPLRVLSEQTDQRHLVDMSFGFLRVLMLHGMLCYPTWFI
ncbi:unnamed protein product [Linum tenue]|uniref:Uncharacterized protein n=1 Tax=Linum tenue TaxID=586396 RepID=A0AAV0NWK4_9ROSI|nr:unnamed protein product [Linum tenue]